MIKRLFVIYILLFSGLTGTAQDIHFSQFFASPLTINPAMTGAFDGAYRFTGIYRDQWRSVTIPYQTVAFSAEARDFKDAKNLGLGANFFYDQAGDSHFTTLHANFSLAWRFPFNRRFKQKEYINIAVQGSFTQRSFNLEKLRFDNQYIPGELSGYYDPNRPAMEGVNDYRIFYPDLNAGIFYYWEPKNRKRFTTGLGIYNITRPNQSFLANDNVPLDHRFTFHAEGQFKVSDRVDAIPQVLALKQGTFYQLTPGIMGKYYVNSNRYRFQAVYAGIYTRARDAAFVTLGMDYNEWYFGLSYDLNYSKLIPASHGRGGWEIAISYIIDKRPSRKKYRSCPDFM